MDCTCWRMSLNVSYVGHKLVSKQLSDRLMSFPLGLGHCSTMTETAASWQDTAAEG